MSNDDEYLGIVGGIGETTGIGHHTTVDAGRGTARHLVEASQLVDDTKHQFTGTARSGTGDDEVGTSCVGVLVMINHQAARFGFLHDGRQFLHAV